MADIFTKKKRSEVMSRIRSTGNKNTELALAAMFRAAGITGWRRQQKLRVEELPVARKRTGVKCTKDSRLPDPNSQKMFLRVRVDFVFRTARVAVFVDGCFWHGCPRHYRAPDSARAFWRNKVETNRARDLRVSRGLRAAGWTVLRVWECALSRARAGRTLARIARALAA